MTNCSRVDRRDEARDKHDRYNPFISSFEDRPRGTTPRQATDLHLVHERKKQREEHVGWVGRKQKFLSNAKEGDSKERETGELASLAQWLPGS